jgi:tRNA 5-methylaminomethyl-2-thiouridine biosynthesis bifunctional protein
LTHSQTLKRYDAAVVGAGLAGASVARALTAAGLTVALVDAEAGPGARASALPVGVLSPHVTRSPTPMSRLSAMGVEATRAYLSANVPQGAGWLDTQIDNCGHDPGRWPAALVRPSALVAAWMAEASSTQLLTCHWSRKVHRPVHRSPDGWCLNDDDDNELLSASHVVMAGAWGSVDLLERSLGFDQENLPLRPVKGQLSFAPLHGAAMAERPRRDKGVFVPCYEDCAMPDGLPHRFWAMGSTYERGRDDRWVEKAAHERNLASLQTLQPEAALEMDAHLSSGQLRGWADVRCASLDRIPLVGQLPAPGVLHHHQRIPLRAMPRLDGLFIVTALGSRGITLALSCGQWLCEQMTSGRMSLPDDLVNAMDPARFAWRRARGRPQSRQSSSGHSVHP